MRFNLNGLNFRFFATFAVVSAVQMVYLYWQLADIEDKFNANSDADKSEYSRNLYQTYRNMLCHGTNIVLVFQVSIVAKRYQ